MINLSKLSITAAQAMLVTFSIAQTAQAVTFQSGDVFVGVGNGYIKEFDSNGSLKATLDSGFSSTGTETNGMAFDSQGNLYTTLFEAHKVVKFNNNGTLVGTFGSFSNTSNPESIVFDLTNNAYVGDGSGPIRKFNSSGTLLATYNAATEDGGTNWIDLAADSKTIRYTSESTSVLSFDVSNNTQLPNFASGLPGYAAYANRILADGGELVADTNYIVRLNSAGTVVQTYTPPAGQNFTTVDLDPSGNTFRTVDLNDGTVYQFDIASGNLLTSFNAGRIGTSVAGLAIFGALTQGATPQVTTVPEPSETLGTLALCALGTGYMLKRQPKQQ